MEDESSQAILEELARQITEGGECLLAVTLSKDGSLVFTVSADLTDQGLLTLGEAFADYIGTNGHGAISTTH